jgi:4'-phosphopantetheinyl transferase
MPVCESSELEVKMLCSPATVDNLRAIRGLSGHEVHVWKSCGTIQENLLQSLRRLLYEDEVQRAERFRFQDDRNRFIVSRGILRTLLAGYLECDASCLHFHYSDRGKPQLPSAPDLHFNVAHSGEVIVWAFARNRRVGIDVEEIRTDFSTQEIAERFFSKIERQTLRSLPTSQRHQAFFQCWTRKEAFVKATGDGLSLPLDQFDVSLAPGQPAQLLQTRPEPKETGRWLMRDLDIHPGYSAALVVERPVSPER